MTLITRDGCHLCEAMDSVVRQVAAKMAFEFKVSNVDADEGLRDRYGHEVPVLLINGRKAFKFRVAAKELRRRVRLEQLRRRASGWRRLISGPR